MGGRGSASGKSGITGAAATQATEAKPAAAASGAGGSRYDRMTDAQLANLPANGKIQREAFGTPGNRTPAQEANRSRMARYAEDRAAREQSAAFVSGRPR